MAVSTAGEVPGLAAAAASAAPEATRAEGAAATTAPDTPAVPAGDERAAAEQAQEAAAGTGAAAAAATAAAAAAASCNALAHTFVGVMRRLNHCRAQLEASGATPLAVGAADARHAHQSIHCVECQQLCYAATAVVAPAGEHTSWRHMCLECAVAAVAAAASAAAVKQEFGEAGTATEAATAAPAGGTSVGPCAAGVAASSLGAGQWEGPANHPRVLLFVKPCWVELEECGQELEQGLQELSGAAADWARGPCTHGGSPYEGGCWLLPHCC